MTLRSTVPSDIGRFSSIRQTGVPDAPYCASKCRSTMVQDRVAMGDARFARQGDHAVRVGEAVEQPRLQHDRQAVGPGGIGEIIERRRTAAQSDARRIERRLGARQVDLELCRRSGRRRQENRWPRSGGTAPAAPPAWAKYCRSRRGPARRKVRVNEGCGWILAAIAIEDGRRIVAGFVDGADSWVMRPARRSPTAAPAASRSGRSLSAARSSCTMPSISCTALLA